MAYQDDIEQMTRQLYPQGRALQYPKGGQLEKLHKALAVSEAQAYSDAMSIQSSMLPNAVGFTADDATRMERWLGIPASSSTSLPNRIAALTRKLNHPGTVKPRLNYRYLEAQLQAAGFSLTITENRFLSGSTYITKTPTEFFNFVTGSAILGEFYLAEAELAESYAATGLSVIANYLEEDLDALFSVGSNYKRTFFVSGPLSGGFGTQATVDAARKTELRDLLHRLKGRHTVGFMYINYV